MKNPFNPEEASRLYKTGDRGRYLPDGNIEFLGRIDNQVKIRGFRIEPGEIEATLAQHPRLKEAVVIAREDIPGDKRLVAYIVAKGAPTVLLLRDFLRTKLPEYMVPAAFVTLEAMPLTPSGKVDRRALPAQDTSPQALSTGFIPPRDSLELQLTLLWENVLNAHPIGVRDNFFELGGHSLLAVQLMAKLNSLFGKDLPLTTLFGKGTVEQQAAILRSSENPWGKSILVPIQPQERRKPPFFCIHPGGGNILCYSPLARHLGTEIPFYGLQSPGLDGAEAPLRRIEDMAVRYLKAIKTVQPAGPYYLGGWCIGGAIALEMAQQLYANGEEVALLALIDTYPNTHLSIPENIDEATVLTNFTNDLAGAVNMKALVSVEELRQLRSQEQLNYIHSQLIAASLLPAELNIQELYHLVRVFQANVEAYYLHYQLRPYPGRIALFVADEKPPQITGDPKEAWANKAGAIEIHSLPGDHYAIIREPRVRVLAQRLQVGLAALQTNLKSPKAW